MCVAAPQRTIFTYIIECARQLVPYSTNVNSVSTNNHRSGIQSLLPCFHLEGNVIMTAHQTEQLPAWWVERRTRRRVFLRRWTVGGAAIGVLSSESQSAWYRVW